MYLAKLASVFIFATFKFMFTPILGFQYGLTSIETYLGTVSGGMLSASIFYFSASYFMKRTQRRRAEGKGKSKKIFTRTNKTIIKVKQGLGIYGTCFLVPLFLSLPIGCIITAKFFKHDKRTFPLITIAIFFNAFVITSLTYLFK